MSDQSQHRSLFSPIDAVTPSLESYALQRQWARGCDDGNFSVWPDDVESDPSSIKVTGLWFNNFAIHCSLVKFAGIEVTGLWFKQFRHPL